MFANNYMNFCKKTDYPSNLVEKIILLSEKPLSQDFSSTQAEKITKVATEL